ncbi:MAG: hypothetical protein KGJ77_11160, partial [Acidobacteriota bacterium]|nr:hypothetical protein [Acidobacteriota bacterium]
MIDPSVAAAASDIGIGLAIAVPVLAVGGGVALALRLRGRGAKSRVPQGEVAGDAATDVELDRSAQATRIAQATPAADGAPTRGPDEGRPRGAEPLSADVAGTPPAAGPVS